MLSGKIGALSFHLNASTSCSSETECALSKCSNCDSLDGLDIASRSSKSSQASKEQSTWFGSKRWLVVDDARTGLCADLGKMEYEGMSLSTRQGAANAKRDDGSAMAAMSQTSIPFDNRPKAMSDERPRRPPRMEYEGMSLSTRQGAANAKRDDGSAMAAMSQTSIPSDNRPKAMGDERPRRPPRVRH
ncbi:hypothetical protein VNO77_22991 [Canavalia gladiata]|uniref:Uncharacterized protein n=1 Tax=Canavalia gladiata TaxID=3824 RepID=A0AAN9QBH0_CANGL